MLLLKSLCMKQKNRINKARKRALKEIANNLPNKVNGNNYTSTDHYRRLKVACGHYGFEKGYKAYVKTVINIINGTDG